MTVERDGLRYEATIRRLDHPAFVALVGAEAAGVLRLAAVVLGTREGADDVVQVAMERAWSSISRYDTARPFRPWFLRIVVNTAELTGASVGGRLPCACVPNVNVLTRRRRR